MDNQNIRYDVYRDGDIVTPVYTVTSKSNFWTRPTLGFLDKDLAIGSTHTYQVKASDPYNNSSISPASAPVTVSSSVPSTYANDVTGDGASAYWRLNEPSGTAVWDNSGFNDATAGVGLTRSVAGAIAGDSNTASTFSGATTATAGTNAPMPTPTAFSVEAWVKTNTNKGGKIVGYGSSQTGLSGSYDRHLYMDNAGHIAFGVYNGTTSTLISSGTFRNSAWHHVVGTMDAGGMNLYVDGKRVGANAAVTTGQAYTGYWRIGGDNLTSWPNDPTSDNLAGTIDEVAVYPTALPLSKVVKHYMDAGGSVANLVPVAAFTTTANNLAVSYDASGSSDPDGTIVSYAWTFGDGSTGTTATPSHTYAAAGNYSVKLTVTDDRGGKTSLTKSVTVVKNKVPTAAFTHTANNLNASFNAAGSSDTDGTIVSYAWDFGDGSTGTTATATTTHAYAAAGTYSVKLTVTDDDGATSATTTKSITLVANKAPTAAFTFTTNNQNATFNAAGSSDTDGTVASYAWDFGDGLTGTTATPSHAYGLSGTYSVKLTVTDDDGATGTITKPVTVTPPPNQLPTAAFTFTANDLDASFNGSGSSDPDGTVDSYAWEFGDGLTGITATPNHAYAVTGTYQVKLTVTDNRGGTATLTKPVSVTGNNAPLAAFTSTTTNQSASFDGSGSSDSDGTVDSYSWDFGDGSTGNTASPNHAYADPGTYQVQLTVTDNDGATGTITHAVTANAPPNEVPTAAFTFTKNHLSASFDGPGPRTRTGRLTPTHGTSGTDRPGTPRRRTTPTPTRAPTRWD